MAATGVLLTFSESAAIIKRPEEGLDRAVNSPAKLTFATGLCIVNAYTSRGDTGGEFAPAFYTLGDVYAA